MGCCCGTAYYDDKEGEAAEVRKDEYWRRQRDREELDEADRRARSDRKHEQRVREAEANTRYAQQTFQGPRFYRGSDANGNPIWA